MILLDIWANYALSCLDFDSKLPCVESIDALTQVADSSIIWIARGLLLELKGKENAGETKYMAMRKAADAYRTALQVSRERSALLGLAMTCRHNFKVSSERCLDDFTATVENLEQQEFLASIGVYNTLKCDKDKFASAVGISSLLEESQFLPSPIATANIREEAKKLNISLNVPINDSIHNKEIIPFLKEDTIIEEASRLIHEILSSTSSNPPTKDRCSVACKNDAIIDLHEQPENAKRWLVLAKTLLRDTFKAEGRSEREIIKIILNAKIAANKCVQIGNESVIHPLRLSNPWTKFNGNEESTNDSRYLEVGPINGNVFRRPTESSFLSEAYALNYWLGLLNPQQSSEPDNDDLQRSLMLDPENTLALECIE